MAGGSLRPVFYVTYMLAELCRRRGRTVLTALGLAIGGGLVVTVTDAANTAPTASLPSS